METVSGQRAMSRRREGAKGRRERRLRAEARIRLQLCRDAVRIASHRGGDGCRRAHIEASTQTAPVDAPPVTEYVAPAPAVALSVPIQQLRPAYTAATVATGVNLDVTGMVCPLFPSTAVEGSASQVFGSLPLGEEIAAPVFNQVHQEQLAGGEIPENLVEISVVPEQVIVQAIPRVAHTLPPAEEFTEACVQLCSSGTVFLQVTRLRILRIFLLCRNR